jgi:hypothetical protein
VEERDVEMDEKFIRVCALAHCRYGLIHLLAFVAQVFLAVVMKQKVSIDFVNC